MNFLILTHQYPKKDNLYRNGFVHQRVKAYIASNYNTEVWVMKENNDEEIYYFDGVKVIEGNKEQFNHYVKKNKIDRILVHFLLENMVEALLKVSINIPMFIWVHGYEALKWNRRLFQPWNFYSWRDLRVRKNLKQLKAFKHFNEKNEMEKISYIFVSNWMKKIAEQDVKTKFKKTYIIPNYINTDLFKYEKKEENQRKKILLIRSFHNRKYATDVAVNAILELSKTEKFTDLEFEIYGNGKYFNFDTRLLDKFSNVKVHNKFLTQEEIADIHKKFGVFLCPTRQDAQGVSMCEAMASGLIPITSNNTAIPEYVTHSETGFLTNNHKEIADSILKLYNNAELFTTMSKMTSDSINQICNYEETIKKELDKIINLQ
ncbi:glycosyltransferase family 4 protein [Bacillus pseudomycoides]|uniref:glycosyltransferase family 4 protein n=1 Tax=Bacillus pseudomycoides TaxID=64104 RepID=UPI000BF146ED|nr:glycosyltransferase family 4 protein [Bacillus pseudomycoides]PEI96075.1 hypothetical protein CN686_13335 [Bacillus pseudomycoides]PEM79340.1 hypothetical protein CN619_00640 [Bacillus pseudomycoides]PGA65183.1 hypothetical protein COL84_00195 [Bacillus pseudomycoides]PHA48642.1 hypothetical protein COE73_16095 [Bacillus pseudomycoides]PHA65605.1 hypothetical protein COE76_03750 [Bacillus pseudomycoides]